MAVPPAVDPPAQHDRGAGAGGRGGRRAAPAELRAAAAAPGREGAFVPVSFWAVIAQALTGDVPGAVARMDALCTVLPRLLPEEIDPVEHTALGNAPLVWSHAELARSLYVLDAVRRQRRWGRAGLWIWRMGRYLSLRLRG